jgi:hypothetical protein
MRTALIIIIMPLAFLFSGCAKMMNENECVAAEWRTVGFLDGSAGRPEEFLERRADACAKYGVSPDLDRYLTGRSQGLESFCLPRSGFYLGLRNTIYNNVCPSNMEQPFLAAYQDGVGLRQHQNRITELESDINAAIDDMDELEEEIAEATRAIADPETPEQERLTLAIEIRNMAEERGNIEATIPIMEAELTAAQVALEDYRASIAGKYPGTV